jgi:hypothetical protein
MPSDMVSDEPPEVPQTRRALHQLAVHVLGRRRHAFTGRFGLRAAPGGVATPAFGDDVEVVRTSGRYLVVERGNVTVAAPITTLAAAAGMVGVDLTVDFSVGGQTPALVDPEQPLAVSDRAARGLGAWWSLGTTAIDEVVATEAVSAPTVVQLWPEHFDVACTVTVAGGAQANLGASPGDATDPLPYLYVGPWSSDRPGDPSFWNAPFGAVIHRADLATLPPGDRRSRAVAFFRRGLALLAAAT